MNTSISLNVNELRTEFHHLNDELHTAGKNMVNRMGLVGEHLAAEKSPVSSGHNRQEIRWTGAVKTSDGWSGDLIAYSAYSIYIELGFKGHFVPFKVAPSLYREAVVKWGWRVPSPAELKNPKPGELYLIPRGRKSATTGVKVSGKAQPFMRPALDEVKHDYRDAIISDELNMAISRSAVR